MKHVPVLLHEVISFLDPGFGKKFIDATFAAAGIAASWKKPEPRCLA